MTTRLLPRLAIAAVAAVAAFSISYGPSTAGAQSFTIASDKGNYLTATVIAEFREPWAMTFLPDGNLLVTTKPGKLFLVSQTGETKEVAGMWPVGYGNQGGLGDVVLHPDFKINNFVYISNAEQGDSGAYGAVVTRVELDLSGDMPAIRNPKRIWTQTPKTSGRGHYSHRIAFGPDGKLFITSGDRQKLDPAQDFDQALGKVIRLNDDGSVPADNPWQDKGDLAKTFWSMGHRNPLGITFDGEGRLWAHEMGPAHGDELNLIVKGENYGWPVVSNGNHYSGQPIPDHDTRPEFKAPKAYWVPAISPAGLIIYNGSVFRDWAGNALIGGLSSRALVRVALDATGRGSAKEVERFKWGKRVREVEQGPNDAVWVLEDRRGGRLLKLMPKG